MARARLQYGYNADRKVSGSFYFSKVSLLGLWQLVRWTVKQKAAERSLLGSNTLPQPTQKLLGKNEYMIVGGSKWRWNAPTLTRL